MCSEPSTCSTDFLCFILNYIYSFLHITILQSNFFFSQTRQPHLSTLLLSFPSSTLLLLLLWHPIRITLNCCMYIYFEYFFFACLLALFLLSSGLLLFLTYNFITEIIYRPVSLFLSLFLFIHFPHTRSIHLLYKQ